MKKSNKKKYLIVALIVLLLALAVGYAAFSDTLTISGTANAKGTFDLEFVQADCKLDAEKSVGIDKDNSTITVSGDKNTATVVVKDLAYPGAGAQFTAVIKNVGTVPAKLKAVTPTGINDAHIKVTFPEMPTGEKIAPQGECTITFTVVWDSESELDTSVAEKQLDFSLELEYEQDTTAFEGAPSHS